MYEQRTKTFPLPGSLWYARLGVVVLATAAEVTAQLYY